MLSQDGRKKKCHSVINMSDESKFKADTWIFVGDTSLCEYSKQQVDVCKSLNLPLKGAILCNDEEQRKSEACLKVPSFPCFCNIETNVCISGLRETISDFEELQRISDESKSSQT